MSKKILKSSLAIAITGMYIYLAVTPSHPLKPMETPRSVGLCIMATGKYVEFVEPLINSAERYFLPGHKHTYFVFTDHIDQLPQNPHITPIFQARMGWPYDSMMRTATYAKNKEQFKDCDYLYACDADMVFVDYIGDEILGNLVGTLHPGFTFRRGTYEQRPESQACVTPTEGKHYFAGGFYGGTQEEFINLIESLTSNIQKDLDQGIVARWHDESHLNRFFIDHEPSTILDTSYCYPEGWSLETHPRLIALTKNKWSFRS